MTEPGLQIVWQISKVAAYLKVEQITMFMF